MCKFAIVPFDDLFLAATLQFSHCLQSMPLQRRLREAVRVEGNSAQGRCLALGFQGNQAPILTEFLAPKKYTLTTGYVCC